jgi:hypothetical protein
MVLDVATLRERLKRTPPAFSVYGDDDSGAAIATAIFQEAKARG